MYFQDAETNTFFFSCCVVSVDNFLNVFLMFCTMRAWNHFSVFLEIEGDKNILVARNMSPSNQRKKTITLKL